MLASVNHVACPLPRSVSLYEQGGTGGGGQSHSHDGLLLGLLLPDIRWMGVSGIQAGAGYRGSRGEYAVMNRSIRSFDPKSRKLPPKQKLRYSDEMKSLWTLCRTASAVAGILPDRRLVFAS